MEKKFEFPEVSVYSFLSSDIVTASPWTEGEGGNEGDLPPEGDQ